MEWCSWVSQLTSAKAGCQLSQIDVHATYKLPSLKFLIPNAKVRKNGFLGMTTRPPTWLYNLALNKPSCLPNSMYPIPHNENLETHTIAAVETSTSFGAEAIALFCSCYSINNGAELTLKKHLFSKTRRQSSKQSHAPNRIAPSSK